ncbi:ribonuclease P 21 kDa subunit [Rhodotorula toruloides]|uniref:Ribonuclease P 21 kDa subunit n=1 Tax=Rhodotorula toruloides TaxID=5286 RepID=A0A511KC04_RHOTO|nr:ribonuclease P 21 kDa subunit [Rhodotorula toruloides]
MGKKGRNTAAEPTAATPVISRDSLQRLSYLYQASILLNSTFPSSAEYAQGKRRARKQWRVDLQAADSVKEEKEVPAGDHLMKHKDCEDALITGGKPVEADLHPYERPRSRAEGLWPVARRVAREMKEVAKKATVRMDPTVKRTVCQGCATVLVPGITSIVRVKRASQPAYSELGD